MSVLNLADFETRNRRRLVRLVTATKRRPTPWAAHAAAMLLGAALTYLALTLITTSN